MIREFEGRNEAEAINNAVEALGISKEEINIELVENKKPLFFLGKGKVKIRVNFEEKIVNEIQSPVPHYNPPDPNFNQKIIGFLAGILERMEISADVKVKGNESNKLTIDIISQDSAILIGKKGKTLDSLQLLANIIANKNNEEDTKIIVDVENYRIRREKNLIHFAKRVADKVRRTRSSMLLEAMNPFERRLIHTTLNRHRDLETVSEGDGLYKKIRVLYKGRK